jgi:DNA polymerase III subunit beta
MRAEVKGNEVIFERGDLARVMKLVGMLQTSKTSRPILGMVKISGRSDCVRFAATDLDVYLQYDIDINSPVDINIMVSAADLNKAVSDTGSSHVSMQADGTKLHLQLMSGARRRADVHLPLADPAESPISDMGDIRAEANIPWLELKDGIKRVMPAVALQAVQYALTALCIENRGSSVMLAGTDTHRLHVCNVKGHVEGPDGARINLALKGAAVMAEALQTTQKDAAIILQENTLRMQTGPCIIDSMTIQGRYPKYHDIMDPAMAADYIFVARSELISAFKHVGNFSTREGACNVILADSVLQISATNDTMGRETYYIPDVDGKPFALNLTGRYMVDALSAMSDEMVHMHIRDARCPIGLCGSPEYCAVVMPITPA